MELWMEQGFSYGSGLNIIQQGYIEEALEWTLSHQSTPEGRYYMLILCQSSSLDIQLDSLEDPVCIAIVKRTNGNRSEPVDISSLPMKDRETYVSLLEAAIYGVTINKKYSWLTSKVTSTFQVESYIFNDSIEFLSQLDLSGYEEQIAQRCSMLSKDESIRDYWNHEMPRYHKMVSTCCPSLLDDHGSLFLSSIIEDSMDYWTSAIEQCSRSHRTLFKRFFSIPSNVRLTETEITTSIDSIRRLGLTEFMSRKLLYTEYSHSIRLMCDNYLWNLRDIMFSIDRDPIEYKIVNTSNTLMENIYDRPPEELVTYIDGDKCYYFTANEVDHMASRKINPYTNLPIDNGLIRKEEYGTTRQQLQSMISIHRLEY